MQASSQFFVARRCPPLYDVSVVLSVLWDLLFRLFCGFIGAVRFFKGVGHLQTVQEALITPNAVINLPRFKCASIVSCRGDATYFPVVLVLTTFQRVSFVSAFVMVCRSNEGIGSVQTERTMLTIITECNKMLRRRVYHVVRVLDFLFYR